METGIKISNNTTNFRFETELDGEFAYIDYRPYKGDIAFLHTDVPEQFKGRGIASALAKAALTFVESSGKKIMLYCPFMSKYVRKHPEYHHLVDRAYHPSFPSSQQP